MIHIQGKPISLVLAMLGAFIWGLLERPQGNGADASPTIPVPSDIGNAVTPPVAQTATSNTTGSASQSQSVTQVPEASAGSPPSAVTLKLSESELPSAQLALQPVPDILALHFPQLLSAGVGKVVTSVSVCPSNLMAQLEYGDIILRVDGVPVVPDSRLDSLLNGEAIELSILRQGTVRRIMASQNSKALQGIPAAASSSSTGHSGSSVSCVAIGQASVVCRSVGSVGQLEMTIQSAGSVAPQLFVGTKEEIRRQVASLETTLQRAALAILDGELASPQIPLERLLPTPKTKPAIGDQMLREMIERWHAQVTYPQEKKNDL